MLGSFLIFLLVYDKLHKSPYLGSDAYLKDINGQYVNTYIMLVLGYYQTHHSIYLSCF